MKAILGTSDLKRCRLDFDFFVCAALVVQLIYYAALQGRLAGELGVIIRWLPLRLRRAVFFETRRA